MNRCRSITQILLRGAQCRAESVFTFGRPVTRNLDAFGYNVRGEVAWVRYGTNTLADIYDYDFIGNFTSNRLRGAWSQFEANELNEYVAIEDNNPRSLAYDADGNLLTNGVWSYAYDSMNRLSVVCSNNLVVTENDFDPFFRRVFRREPSGEHGYLYDDWNPIRETITTEETTAPVENYWGKDMSGSLQGAGGVGGLIVVNRTDGLLFPLFDNIGNVVSYHVASNIVLPVSTYDVFGRKESIVGSFDSTFTHGFSTKPIDQSTDLYYYGYRFYDGFMGRWLSRDPLEEKIGVSLYVFVDNCPLLYYDSFGLFYPAAPASNGEPCCDKGNPGIKVCKLVSKNDGELHGGEKEYNAHQKYKRDKAYWDLYYNVLLPQYENELMLWTSIAFNPVYPNGAPIVPSNPPLRPVAPNPPVKAINPYLCFSDTPKCEPGWQQDGKPFFWATGNGTLFSGNDYNQIATPISCDKNNCFEIETRYMTMAITIPFPPLWTYTPPHINEFYFSQWCCRCVVSDGQQPINTPAGK